MTEQKNLAYPSLTGLTANTTVYSIAFPVAGPDSVADLIQPLRDDPIRMYVIIVGISGVNPLSPASKMLFCGNFIEIFAD